MKKFLGLLALGLVGYLAFADTPGQVLKFTAPLNKAGVNVSIPKSDSTHNGYLASADFNTFSSTVGLPSQTGQSGKYLTTDGSTPSWASVASPLIFSDSLVNISGTVTLVNDSASPGNSKYYGTNGGGTLGYFSLPSSAVWGSITGTLSNQTDLQTALNGKEPTITAGTNLQYWRGDKSFQTLNTLAVPELTNLYYTQGRFDSAFAVKSTTDLSEGSNLYYTQARFDTAFSGKSTTNLTEGSNLYYTAARFNSAFSGKSTTDLTEGTNLYYTAARFNAAFAGKSTTDLSEGTNLYFTNARAQGAVSASAPLVDTVGVFSIPQSTTSVDGYLSAVDWTTFNNKAPINSPALTGVPTAPTAGVGTSTTQIATTAFVLSQGFQGATGSMPFASSTSLVTTTSATTTFVNAITTSITITASSAPVLAKCVLDMTSATAASVATVRVTVNGVTGGSVTESLTTATTQHLTVPNQNMSTALGPGTYTVNCDFNRASGTGTVTVGQGSLTAVGLQGTESNGISQLTGLGLSAGPGSGLQSLTGTLTLAGGGTNANNTAVNGGVVYSTASALNISAAGTSGQLLRSAGAAAPTWTAETFPASTTINQILYSSAANVVSGLATANTGALVTSNTGVPSIVSGATANRLLRTNGTTVSFAQANLTTDVTGTLPFAQGGTGGTSYPNQRIPFSNGSAFVTDGAFLYDTSTQRFSVGSNSSAKIGAFVGSGSDLGMQSYCQGTNNCMQIRNQSAYNLQMYNANDANVVGILVGAERSRGVQNARTQSLNGDIGLQLVGSCYTGAASSTGFDAAIQYIQSEDCTSSANGGEIAFNTTPNTTTALVERARITNDGQSKFHYGVTLDTSTTQPTCDVAHRGNQWIIQGGLGVADIFQICQKTALDTYIWVTH